MKKVFSIVMALALAAGCIAAAAESDGTVYVLMNIPYAAFYKAELPEGSAEVDGVTSATMSKTRNPNIVGGSYHVNADGSDITGVTYAVKAASLDDVKSLGGIEVTDETESETYTLKVHGEDVEFTLAGKDRLMDSPSYSWYVLSEEPASYKELTIGADGSATFGKATGDVTEFEAETVLAVSTKHADYEIAVSGLPEFSTTYAAIITDSEGSQYGLRHLANIFRGVEVGFNAADAPYGDIVGRTIVSILFYTDQGLVDAKVNVEIPAIQE